jgi:hypothetical protein
MKALVLNQRTVKLDSFDPHLLTALAQKIRHFGGTFRTSLLPKKRVATLTFSSLPSVSLPEILHEVTNSQTNSTPTNISEQQLFFNNSCASSVAIATTPSTTTPAPSSETVTTQSTNSPEPVPFHQSIASPALNLEPLTESTNNPKPVPDAAPDAAHSQENILASLEKLLGQRKTKLKKLAQQYKIPGRSSMTHEQKAHALVGIVLVRDL